MLQQTDYFGKEQLAKKSREHSNSRSPTSQKEHINPVRQLKEFLEQSTPTQKTVVKKPGWVFRDPKPRENIPQRFAPYQTSIRLHSPKANKLIAPPTRFYLDNSLGKDLKKKAVSPQAKLGTDTSDYKLQQANFVVKAKLEQKLNQSSRLQSSRRLKYP